MANKQYCFSKMVLVIMLMLNAASMYAAGVGVPDLSGTWVQKSAMTGSNFSEATFLWGTGKVLPHHGAVCIDVSANRLSHAYEETLLFSFDRRDEHTIIAVVYDSDDRIAKNPYTIAFHFLDIDTMWIEFPTINVGSATAPLYRASGGARFQQVLKYGMVNDNNVRLRSKPNLQSEIWNVLQQCSKVEIIEKSTEKQTIDNVEAFWYKVRSEHLPDGWVFGAYVDLVEYEPHVVPKPEGW